MDSLRALVSRTEASVTRPSTDSNNKLIPLLVSLIGLLALGIVCVGSLYCVKRCRNKQKAACLPLYHDNGTQLTIHATRGNRESSFLVYSEKQQLMTKPSPLPPSSADKIPEIRITFPEEEDENGKRMSSRVVVVQVGEAGVGFVRPLEPEILPPYQNPDSGSRFASLDLDCIGGLKEKDENRWV